MREWDLDYTQNQFLRIKFLTIAAIHLKPTLAS